MSGLSDMDLALVAAHLADRLKGAYAPAEAIAIVGACLLALMRDAAPTCDVPASERTVESAMRKVTTLLIEDAKLVDRIGRR